MNSNKKLTPPRGIPQPFNRQAGAVREFKPVVAQLKSTGPAPGSKRPVAPPVYRPQPTPKVLQTKTAPVAPPVYRPEVKKIAQPKIISAAPLHNHTRLRTNARGAYAPAKIAHSRHPVTVKRTAFAFSAVQLAEKKAKKPRKACYATVVADSGARFDGKYKKYHAEMDALENYLGAGGALGDISSIDLSSAPCKYCHFILKDLGLLGKVVTPDKRDFGSCSGGSFLWFGPYVWAAIQAKKGVDDMDAYIDTVIERKDALK